MPTEIQDFSYPSDAPKDVWEKKSTGIKKYVGSKIILAEPMDECSFLQKVKGQNVDNRETRPGYKVHYEDGYISWSPADVFERCYREITDQEINMLLNNS